MAFQRTTRKPREKVPLDAAALYNYAVGLLSRQMRTVAQLKRLMRRRAEEGEPGEAAMDAVVQRLKEMKYLNDTRFAADYTRLRQENEKFGKRRVQQELMLRGVHKDIIAPTLEAAYGDVDETELMRRFIARKRLKQPTDQKQTARVMRMLIRAGFGTPAIFKVLKAWNVDEEALSALEGMDEPPQVQGPDENE